MGAFHDYCQLVFVLGVVAIAVEWLPHLFKSMQRKLVDNLRADMSVVDGLFCAAVHEKQIDDLPDGGDAFERRMELTRIDIDVLQTKSLGMLGAFRRVMFTIEILHLRHQVTAIRREIEGIRKKK